MIEITSDGKVIFIFDYSTDEQVYLVGDFNNWDEGSHPLKKRDDGRWFIGLKLPPGEYEFKYKVGAQWYNDYAADNYVQNVWGSDNSVVIVKSK